MPRLAIWFLGAVFGAAAIIAIALYADSRSSNESTRDSLAAIRRRLDEIQAPPPVEVELPAQPLAARPDPVARESLASLSRQLDELKAAVARLEESRTPPPSDPAAAKPPAPKAKDQKLVVDLATKGSKDPGANARDRWGWSTREIQMELGKPDSTKLSVENGYQDWFYMGPDGNLALQVRFESGVVIGVWP